MDRRRFLQDLAASTAAVNVFPAFRAQLAAVELRDKVLRGNISAKEAHVEGHTLLTTFTRNGDTWETYEDLGTRDGAITFVSSRENARILRKTAEATFPEEGPQYLGLDLK